MITDNKENEDKILFPINQGEQAKQPAKNNLLALDVFKKIAELLKLSLKKQRTNNCVELDDSRAHEAILIDGGRGAGKSSVLVNLNLYMNSDPELKDNLLVLKPVDPTLLDEGDDLFLNIIVAALIRDKQIKNALDKGDRKAEEFYDQLQKLGNTLEGVQTQQSQYGLDKLRAFIGTHGIADEVHNLLYMALQLTNKRLIVLPIDDVDTSLQHAFENMEVVRKYLASPYVVPIISGDLDLYHDVTWRDFYGRIIKNHKVDELEAKERSQKLSNEYKRKILPLSRRIDMPDISSYLKSESIFLTSENEKGLSCSIKDFCIWLDVLLNDRGNGTENSHLTLPINSIREFSQLVFDLRFLVSEAADILHKTKGDRNLTARVVIGQKNIGNTPDELDIGYREKINDQWRTVLENHFSHHEHGGPVFLVMSANRYWREKVNLENDRSIFDTDLFCPLNQTKNSYNHFIKVEGIHNNWSDHLQSILPDQNWRAKLPTKNILPYPLPEQGMPWNSKIMRAEILHNQKKINVALSDINHQNYELLRQLLSHHNFYTKSKTTNIVFTGRLFELIILSLIRDINKSDLQNILVRAPFYSAPAMTQTKLFDYEGEDFSIDSLSLSYIDDAISELATQINTWRNTCKLANCPLPNSWFIYNVMNKYFNQSSSIHSWIFDINLNSKKRMQSNASMEYIFDVGTRSFQAIWACFGSFEKGAIFELDNKISTSKGCDVYTQFQKTNLYLQNIAPFINPEKKTNDLSYTNHLSTHPLKELIHNVFTSTFSEEETMAENVRKDAVIKNTRLAYVHSLEDIAINYLEESKKGQKQNAELSDEYYWPTLITDFEKTAGNNIEAIMKTIRNLGEKADNFPTLLIYLKKKSQLNVKS